ncbi:MerR family mercuric resistance operon transcriptional regulator [Sphingomonas naasensis]|uniref:MerR family transcriptional regulator n=1 Tax=Sphingomonas naasensis TaxID=1344951 RepID=A0A4S1W9Z4_9SPHN|nr:MerR family DNA-binding protein [Sphingomonas naasensis]NIJ21256.1 MerR family mercuric resistance operon transcriptional regulator [Sphingomonas naasensis]TGX38695.1 MerR family transcriptional regulator [Sphingomonas naasensis]
MDSLTIAGLAKAGDVGVETARYYQRRGLLPEPPRTGGSGLGGGIRRYGSDDVRRLRFIRNAQTAGFTLEEIAELLALDATQDRARVRALATARIAALDSRIAELEAARAALGRLAAHCSASDRGPCPILEAFDPAGGVAKGGRGR